MSRRRELEQPPTSLPQVVGRGANRPGHAYLTSGFGPTPRSANHYPQARTLSESAQAGESNGTEPLTTVPL